MESSKKTINIIIDGKAYKALEGDTILKVAKKNKIQIPTLCNDDRLEPFSSCFVCVVEIEGMKNMQPSCSTKANEGMVIQTNSNKVKAARKTALDLLLSNHYADCAAPCKQTCPAGVDVQGYISLIEKEQYSEAIKLIKEVNPLPAICGRVCVRPCEVACRRNLLDEGTAVGIDYLKRYAADQDLESENRYIGEVAESTGKKVAVIGAGPGGLSTAWFLQSIGHQCDIYEAAPNPGGWLRYGIPEYRLPNDILDKEVAAVTELGAKIHYKQNLGENLSYKELQENYDATVLTIGSQKGTLIGCKGDDAENVFSGIDFLKNMEVTGQRYDFKGKTVAVVGGGNTAMDCCRTSMRCGAEKVYVIYRRTEKEMPANPIEIHESKLEGIEYLFLTNPTKVNKDDNGVLKSMTLLKMELGEPDASGRRRPVPIEGSEFELELDFVLAAIGQKTDVNFINDINTNVKSGELKINRWGDIDVNKETLQTGIDSMFAAGDGVSGPATIIEAIAQAKVAALSCDQYLKGQEIKPEEKEFLSKKDNFKTQEVNDYKGFFATQKREEMPVLDANIRVNFNEVELGYETKEIAHNETARCLECGCTEYHTCDLKKYSTEYGAEQDRFAGDFKEHPIDFSHPYIEIDNNKCILCARCVRICKEVVGANALGLVERGFETYVAPSMGNSLKDTDCESCGMCISTCPTGAITENKSFKPGPVKLDEAKTICNYCSVGCEISLHHKNGFVWDVTGSKGLINSDGNICRYPKFGYNYLNNNRITKPLLKKGNKFVEVEFDEAYQLIANKIKQGIIKDENAFYGGARLTNEEQYLIQKLARVGAKTNHVNNFHYLFGNTGYIQNSTANVELKQLEKAERIYIIGSEINRDHAVVGFIVNKQKIINNTQVELITTLNKSEVAKKVHQLVKVKSYYKFIKAAIHYLLANNKQNQLFINDNCTDFDSYKETLLNEDFIKLVKESGLSENDIIEFANTYNKEQNAVIIFSEKQISANCSYELFNLALITGKLEKTASGIIALKEKNNSQGLFDMGVCNKVGIGTVAIDNEQYVAAMKETWGIESVPAKVEPCNDDLLNQGQFKNLFIFGEDPVGCTHNKAIVDKWFSNADFVMVQDYFMSETAKQADLIIPATSPAETGGSYTNNAKIIQQFEKVLPTKIEQNNIEQIIQMLNDLGSKQVANIDEVRLELFALLPKPEEKKYNFNSTEKDNFNRFFEYGCDSVVKLFDEEFDENMN